MERKLLWRSLLFGFLGIYAILYLLPTFMGTEKLPKWFSTYVTDRRVLKGLDLAGGVHLEYTIDTDLIIENQLENWVEDIKSKLMELYGEDKTKDDSDHFTIYVRGNRIEVTFKGQPDRAKLEKAFKPYMDPRAPKLVLAKTEGSKVVYLIDPIFAKDLEDRALAQAVETIRDRVDKFGVASPEIYRKDDMIVVELPGLDKASQERIKRIIMKSAHLEFKMVDAKDTYMKKVLHYMNQKYGVDEAGIVKKGPWKGIRFGADSYGSKKKGGSYREIYIEMDVPSRNLPTQQQQEFIKARKQLEKLFSTELAKAGIPVPPSREIGYERTVRRTRFGAPTKDKIIRTYIMYKHTKITGEYIVNAEVGYDQQGQAVVDVKLNRVGGRLFGEMTGKHIGWKMAIKLDDWVTSAPVIQDQIFQNVRITLGIVGSPSQRMKEAEDLVAVLRAGALPAPLTMAMELTVGPSLGKVAIARGELAFAIGAGLVVLFMIFYYKLSGFIAVLALLLNMVFLLSIMAAFEARLTLPGIAGIVLTVGMAVDANVIIFERIREELRLGKKVRAAVDAAYSRAFWTIMDAQITTAIAGIVLYEFGTGPIKGFAVTLIIGIITSIVTGVYFTRLLFDYWTSKNRNMETLSI